jgi:hypothetical protein
MTNDDLRMQAKRKMLKELKKLMAEQDFGEEGNSFKSKMKKVTVASPSSEGLQKGLSLAEKLMAKKKEIEGEEGTEDPKDAGDLVNEDGEGEEEEEESYMEGAEDDSPEDKESCPICGKEHGNKSHNCKV